MTDVLIAGKRLAALFDDGAYTEIGSARMEGAAAAAVITAYGYINGSPVYAFSQNPEVQSGAVGKAHVDKICKLYELAERNGVPVVGIYDSCGAFVEDGAAALCGYSKILAHMGNLSGVVPTASVIAGVCAGSMAVIAAGADFSVMTSDAKLYMTVNPDNDSAEAAAANGAVSLCTSDDASAFEAVRKYLTLMPQNNLTPAPEFDFAVSDSTGYASPAGIADADSLLEICPDFGTGAYTALCTVGGMSVGIAAVQNGTLSEDDCSKLARFIRICDSFSLPVITLVDTEGWKSAGVGAVKSAARISAAYAEATCTKIAVITGKAYGAAFVAFAGPNVNADAVYALPNAVIAPISPSAAAEFLSHDSLKGVEDTAAARQALAEKYEKNEFSAFAAAGNGAVDEVIAPEQIRASLISAMEMTAGKRPHTTVPKKHSNMPM